MQSVDSQAVMTGEPNRQKVPSAAGQAAGLIRSLIFCYLLIGLLLWSPLYQAVVLRPFGPNEHYDAVRRIPNCKEYFIPNGRGDKLHAWFFHIPRARKLVIVHHGNAGNITHRMYLANAAIMCGAAVLLYDYRGYGLSTGKPSLAGLSEDGAAVYDFASGRLGFTPDQIVNLGESIGTGVACRVASTRPSAGLILQSPVASLPAVARAGVFVFGAYPDFAFPQPHFDNLSEIVRVRVPVLLLHGKKDRLVPYQHSQWIMARAAQPKQLVLFDDAGHNDMPAGTEPYQAALSKFLGSLP